MSDIRDFSPLWGEWEVDSKIGEGSFGAVWKVRREAVSGKIYYAAVKHISIPRDESEIQNLMDESVITDQGSAISYYDNMLRSLSDEIDTMHTLRGYTNIVSYEDHKIVPKQGGVGYDIFLRMELLTPLTVRMKERMTTRDVVRLGKDIATAIDVLNHHHLVHRDIKPQNIFINSTGDYKLGDYGTARAMETVATAMSRKGTYNYMAPEIYRNQPADNSVDIYSLGLVMYRLMNNNRLPFLPQTGNISNEMSENAFVARISGKPLPPPVNADDELSHIILKACAFRSQDRYQSAKELKQDLENYQIKEDVYVAQGNENTPGKEASGQFHFDTSAQNSERIQAESCKNTSNREKNSRNSRSIHDEKSKHQGNSIQIQIETTQNEETVVESEPKDAPPKKSVKRQTKNITTVSSPNTPAAKKTAPLIIGLILGALLIAGGNLVFGGGIKRIPTDESVSTTSINVTESATTQTTEPTPEPTAAPTTEPTPEPTEVPTTEPTAAPTKESTPEPTEAPTTEPTAAPTKEPTPEPTEVPTTEPTATPTQKPTNTPEPEEHISGGFKYIILTDGTAEITGYTGISDSVEIPYIIDQHFVTSIGESAFSECSARYISIPYGVTVIGKSAFYMCNAENITIPGSVTSIGSMAFLSCKSLKSIFIPDGITKIESRMFEECESLTSVIIPDSVSSIGSEAFENCKMLTALNIPANVTYIGNSAFLKCEELKHITIPENVTYIGEWAFWGCQELESLTIPDGVNEIGYGAFYNCPKLTVIISKGTYAEKYCKEHSVKKYSYRNANATGSTFVSEGEISDHVTTAPTAEPTAPPTQKPTNTPEPEAHFSGEYKYIILTDGTAEITYYTGISKNIEIPKTIDQYRVTSIGNSAFFACTASNITIPDSVTVIRDGAFTACHAETISIPNSVTFVGSRAFWLCRSLKSIVIPDGVTSIETNMFSGCESLTTVILPDSVTSLGYGAFMLCEELTSLAIPDGVNHIENDAFENCPKLTVIVSEGTYAEKYCKENNVKYSYRDANDTGRIFVSECELGDHVTTEPTQEPTAPPTQEPTNTPEPEEHNSGGFKYIILKDGTAEITRYTGTSKDVEIPRTIVSGK